MMKLTREQIVTLNEIAKTDFTKAQAMLEGMNMVLGTKYGWLGGRVVWFEEPDASCCIKYRNAHDAYAWAE